MYTYKVMIHPNNKQETKIRRTLNKCIECNNIVYDYLDNILKAKQPFPKCTDVRKWFTIQKSIHDNETKEKRKNMTKKEMISNHLDTLFYDVSNDALKQEIKDTYNSFVRFFKKQSKYPVKKGYKSYKKSFYVDPYKIEFECKKVKLEKIANNQKENRLVLNYISLAERNRIPTNATYYNPRIVLEGDRFYIVVGVNDEYRPKNELNANEEKTIGIDINIKAIVTSDDKHYASVVRFPNYKKTKRKYKRAQNKLSKKYEVSKILNKKLRDSKNYIKQRKIKNKYQKRLLNLQKERMVEIIEKIIEAKPTTIVLETLDVKEMKEAYNKQKKMHKENPDVKVDKQKKDIAKGIQENPFRKFIDILINRTKKYGIEIIYADKYYASSKRCHICGYKKDDLKLSDRIFKCPKCQLVIDRDYNAAINLKNYINN